MSDEWRVEVNLDDEEHGYSLGERLRSHRLDDEARERLGGGVTVTRDGARLFLYAASETGVREAERVIRELIAEDRLTAEVAVTRYHEVEGAWKDASIPLPASEEEAHEEYERKEEAAVREAEREGRYGWEVRLDLPGHREAERLADRLVGEGLPVRRRWRHVHVGVPTEERAVELADRLRGEIPEGSEVAIDTRDLTAPPFFVLGT